MEDKVKKTCLVIVALLIWLVCLSGEEFSLRKADDLRLEDFHFRTADNCEIIFWSDLTSGDRNIRCQKFNAQGQAIWAEPIAVVNNPGDQNLADVVPSSDNNFIILWEEYEIDTVNQLRLQKVTSNGQSLWPQAGISLDMVYTYPQARLVPNNTGGAFVLYKCPGWGTISAQSIDAYGNMLWPIDGLLLVTPTNYINIIDAVPDGTGGFILNLRSYQSAQPPHRLVRYSAQGLIVGNDPLIPFNVFSKDECHILQSSGGQFILYQKDESGSIEFNRIDASGNLAFPVNIVYDPGTSDFVTLCDLATTPSGGVVFAWRQGIWGGNHNLMIQKLDHDFLPLWTQSGVIVDTLGSEMSDTSLDASSNGSTWLSWYSYNEPSPAKAQVFSSEGSPLWEQGGKILTTDIARVMTFGFADRGLFFWNDENNGMDRLCKQVIGTNGALSYPPGGETVVQKLRGQAYIYDIFALNDRYITLWQDDRDGYKIYYQISDQNMQPLLAPNGVALNPVLNDEEYQVSLQATPDGKLAVLYNLQEQIDGSTVYETYLQLIDHYGERLYPGRGIHIPPQGSYGNGSVMGISGNDIYLAWMESEDGIVRQIIGQRVCNGQLMWGENGKVITSAPQLFNIEIKGIVGSYFIWETQNAEQDRSFCKALKVDQNGDPASGWTVAGSNLILDNDYDEQDYLKAGLVNDDLISFVRLSGRGAYPVRAQRLSSDGLRMWNDAGLSLSSSINYPSISDVVYGNEIAYVILDYSNDTQQALFQKLSLSGEMLLPEDGISFTTNLHNCYDADLVKFADGSYLCAYTDNDGAWIQNRDVYYRQISPNGAPMGDHPTVLCSERYQQQYIRGAIRGNKAVFAWSDDRAGIMNSETAYTGVWGNSVISSYVAIDDPLETPSVVPEISGNYPNPFNPSTTIAFALPAGGEVSLSVFNLKGQLVRTILNEAELEAGKHTAIWDGTDSTGRIVSSGVYFCALKTAGKTVSRKMLLTK